MSDKNQNDLKNFLVNQYEDWIYPNRKILGGLVFFVIAILIVLFFLSRSNADVKASAWEQYFKILVSPDPIKPLEEFTKVKDGFFEYQSAITAGQLLLAEACNTGFTDKSQATKDLEKALAMFQNVRDGRKANAKFKRQAALGIAQVHEAMAGVRAGSNDLDSAIVEYKKITELWQGEYEAKIAETQLNLLNRTDTKKFYDRYATAAAELTPNPDDFKKIEIDKNAPLIPNSNPLLDDEFFKDNTSQQSTEIPKKEPTEKSETKPIDEPKKEPTEKSETKSIDEPKKEPAEKSETKPIDEPKKEPTEKSETKPVDEPKNKS
ncbi:MAG: hypothetical protein LBB88_10880 [Planctomycetaceae bacterium]|jgi:hypothetical protein|nr:hypothetical protein [Planctomycetaceae bacterium]